jgi:hypothetical protein
VLTVAVSGLVAAVVGMTTAAADASLGPHTARYEVSVDHAVTVDLGPLGSLVLDSPMPWPLGVEVVVGEIPADLASVGTSPGLALSGDLEGYLQFFTAPGVAVRSAALDLAADALGRTVLAWSLLLVLAAAARMASPRLLREDARRILERPGVGLLVGAVVLGVAAVPVLAAGARGNTEGRTSPVLAGTPLAGARIVGRLGDFVDTYGARAVAAVEENEEFYARATASLAAAYAADPEPLAPRVPATLGPAQDVAGVPAGGAGAPAAGGEGATDGATGGASPAPSAAPTGGPEDLVTVLVVSDLHCNVGMAALVGDAVRLAGARAVLNAGDTVIAGTSVERFCVDALARAVPGGVPVVVADGNHDSATTSEQERAAGFIVLGGEPVVVEGVRILGDVEPTLTTVPDGTRLKGEETRDELAARLAGRACEALEADEPVDVLLVHNPRAGGAAMATGCVPLQLSGHLHRQIGPVPAGLGLLHVIPSTGGATAGRQTIGPLNAPGVLTVVRLDPIAHRPVDHRLVTVGTDASATLGPWLPYPEPAAEVTEVDLGADVPGY